VFCETCIRMTDERQPSAVHVKAQAREVANITMLDTLRCQQYKVFINSTFFWKYLCKFHLDITCHFQDKVTFVVIISIIILLRQSQMLYSKILTS